MYLTDSWYWNQNEARKWSRRYFEKMKKCHPVCRRLIIPQPAISERRQAAGSDDTDKVMAKLGGKINDLYPRRLSACRRQHDSRYVSDAGEVASRIQRTLGLLQSGADYSG
jgi:hypothetical protein